MIKTDRQLAKTREQLALLEQSLARHAPATPGVHPLIAEAGQRALRAQADDLRTEIEEYFGLRDGSVPAPDLRAVGRLHMDLVRARIAAGLSQAELARRLGLDPQQIQRYEANDYQSASLARLRQLAEALGGPPAGPDTGALADDASLARRLVNLGLPRSVARRLAPGPSRPQPFGLTAATAAEAIGMAVEDLLAPDPPVLAASRPGFKMPVNASSASVAAYATYARVLAGLVATASRVGAAALPASPDEIRAAVTGRSGVPFRTLVEFAWEHGVAVLPLSDGGAFHAAFWDVDGTGVVVLKQGARTADRWAFDLAHELCHAADHRSGRRPLPDGLVDDEAVSGWAADPEERRANRFAGRVLLGRSADALAADAASRAAGRADWLKGAVVATARGDEGVSVGALANYVAFRVAQEGLDWWGAAANLQDNDDDPWRIARDVLLSRLDFSSLPEQSRGLLILALAD